MYTITDVGSKRSSTIRNNNSILYIFESKNGKKIVFDGLNAFARVVRTNAANLYRTFKHEHYWSNGWRLTECLDLQKDTWEHINKKLRKCKIIDRISEKLDAIEKHLLSIRYYGKLAWKKVFPPKKEQFDAYVKEKEEESQKSLAHTYTYVYSERVSNPKKEEEEEEFDPSSPFHFGVSEYTIW